MARRSTGIQYSDRQKLMTALVDALYHGKTSFTLNRKNYQFNDQQHVRNTLNKIRREEFNKKQSINQPNKTHTPMFLFFDTETTGKPRNYDAPMTDLNNWPRVIQLGYVVYSDDGVLMSEFCSLIKPDGWVIPKEKFWIDNGYSTEKNKEEGLPINRVLDGFIGAANSCHTMVAHNMAFDYNILGAEMIRAGMKAGKKLERICTMDSSTTYCKLPGRFGTYKFPSLTELHRRVFNEGFEGAHDALADVKACARCFFKLKELGVIKTAAGAAANLR